MTYDEIPSAIRAVIGCWTAYRRLGFPGDNIWVQVAPTPGTPSDALGVFVVLKADGKEFSALVGLWPKGDEAGFQGAWEKAALAGNQGGISQEDSERIWQESLARRDSFGFVMSLVRKGFRFPHADNDLREAVATLNRSLN
jgi:hypothetical protein